MGSSDKHYQDLKESQTPNDEFEVELIDLDALCSRARGAGPEPYSKKAPYQSNVSNGRNDSDDRDNRDHRDEEIAANHVRVSLRSRLALHQRLLRASISVAIVVVALVLILNSIIPVHTLLGLLVRPTHTTTLAPTSNTDYFYLDASPPWGKLTLDGHPLIISTIEPVQLARGRHQFTWQADPFRAMHCTLTVPVAATDTCKHISFHSSTTGSDEAQEVTFYDTLNMLPPTQQTALIHAVQTALDAEQSTTTVQPGEQFVHFVGSHYTDVATQPLQATLHFDLSIGDTKLENILCANVYNIECSFLHTFQAQSVTQNCAWFCTESNTYTTYTVPNYWQAVVIAHEYWDYSTLDGRAIATDQPDTDLDLADSAHFISLNIVWDGFQWQSVFNAQDAGGFNTLACLAANNEFTEIPPPIGLNSFGFSQASTKVSALGCVEIVQATAANPSSSVPASPPQALCLYRFGVMLAANALAHRYWPHMPVATAYEQSLAKRLVATQPIG